MLMLDQIRDDGFHLFAVFFAIRGFEEHHLHAGSVNTVRTGLVFAAVGPSGDIIQNPLHDGTGGRIAGF